MHPVLIKFGAVLIPSYGAMSALGVLTALLLAQRTTRRANLSPAEVWNVCATALFSALFGARLLLVLLNWRDLLAHPLWMLALATIHNPWIASAGVLIGALAAFALIRWQQMPAMPTLDALAAPLTLILTCEQVGGLLAGAGYGTETSVPWAVTYTDPLAQRWSGTPLGIALHPVQAYAALAYAALTVFLLFWMPRRRQPGDVAGIALMGLGVSLYVTEFWRDPEGRGQVLHGALDAPQVAAIALLLLGAWLLRARQSPPQNKVADLEAAHD